MGLFECANESRHCTKGKCLKVYFSKQGKIKKYCLDVVEADKGEFVQYLEFF